MKLIDYLRSRHLVEAVTSPEVENALEKPMTIYAGFDPSADSLQAGNYATIMLLANLQRAGHRIIALVGGATGLIGDPSGKSVERKMLTVEQVQGTARLTNLNSKQVTTTSDFDVATIHVQLIRSSYSVDVEGLVRYHDQDGHTYTKHMRAHSDYIDLSATGYNLAVLPIIFLE